MTQIHRNNYNLHINHTLIGWPLSEWEAQEWPKEWRRTKYNKYLNLQVASIISHRPVRPRAFF